MRQRGFLEPGLRPQFDAVNSQFLIQPSTVPSDTASDSATALTDSIGRSAIAPLRLGHRPSLGLLSGALTGDDGSAQQRQGGSLAVNLGETLLDLFERQIPQGRQGVN